MEDNNEEIPEIQSKQINGVEITNLEIAKIGMLYDFLVLDRFQDYFTFFRLEKCFGPFFLKESPNFFPEVFHEICGPKKKYISYGRLILAYTKWKSKSSTNTSFNKFFDIVFNNIIVTKEQNIGKIVEGGRIFSTRNNRGRKIISRFSVLTDESKNKINGFHIQYDDVFDTILSPDKTRNNITLEMNFPPNGRNIRDRDGISHIGGKYSNKKGIIKFLMFKCRSGKTFYIGDEKEEEGEDIKNFLFGTSSCQLKSVRIEVIDGDLTYFEPKFQPSLRVNPKIKDFDSIDENYIKNDIIDAPLIFEENEMKSMSQEDLEKNNMLIIPCINDDAFIDKKELEEPLIGKDFNEIYKSFLVQQKEEEQKEVEDLKNKLYEKTIMRKHLLRIYLRKFKVKENISILRTNRQPKNKISQDKFLAKIKAYRKKMDKNIEEKKEELKKEKSDNDSYWDDEEEKDWPKDEGIEIEEKKEDKKEEIKEEEKKEEKEDEIKEEEKKEGKKDEIKDEEKKEEVKEEKIEEIPIIEENKKIYEEEKNEIKIELNKDKKEDNEQEKIVLRGKPKKLLKNKINNVKKFKEDLENNKEDNKEEPKNEININKEENKEEDKKEEIKKDEIKIEQKIEEPKKDDIKLGESKKENSKKITHEMIPKDEIIIDDKEEIKEKLITDKSANKEDQKEDEEIKPKVNKCFCNIY